MKYRSHGLVGVVVLLLVLPACSPDVTEPASVGRAFVTALYDEDATAVWDMSTNGLRAQRSPDELLGEIRREAVVDGSLVDVAVQANIADPHAEVFARTTLLTGQQPIYRLLLEHDSGAWSVANFSQADGPWPRQFGGPPSP